MNAQDPHKQAEQYFTTSPSSADVRHEMHVTLRGHEADVETSNGVFSGGRVEIGRAHV